MSRTDREGTYARLSAQLPHLLENVATHLGPDWSFSTSFEYSGFLNGPDDASLFVRIERGSPMWKISGTYPGKTYARTYHKIQVNPARGADVIAREITRRLLPDYLQELTRVREQETERVKTEQESRDLADRIASLIPDAKRHGDGYAFTYYGERGYFRLSVPSYGGKLRVEHMDGDPDVVITALLALVEADKRAGEPANE